MSLPANLIVERHDIQGAIEHAHALLVAASDTPPTRSEYWEALAAGVLGAALWLANEHTRPEVLDWLIAPAPAQDTAATWNQLDATDLCVINARQRLSPYLSGQHDAQDVLAAMFHSVLATELIAQ